MTASLDRRVAEGPDPDGARPHLERYLELGGEAPADDEGQALLVSLLSSGSFLPEILMSDVGRWEALRSDPFLRRPKPREIALGEVVQAVDGARDLPDLQKRLRLYRRREMLRLGARETWGLTLEVARELSALADASLEAAVAFSDAQLRAGFGEPISPERTPSFVVLGMGKLGGDELNFSSDVDLIYVYSTDEGVAGRLSLHEYYARLSQMVTAALSEITSDGLIFRVDLRLRPEGRSGAICNSLAASESYYESFGRTWERQALLRARPAAGDRALGDEILTTLAPFIYPRSVGPTMLDDVLGLRKLFRATAEGPAWNVKLGRGGIRDIELVAQLLQLLHAGKRPELRERATLVTLQKLALAGLLTDQETRSLSAAYRVWRQIEHRLQLVHAAQTHELPADDEGMELLARRLGVANRTALDRLLAEHQAAVVAVSETLGQPEGGPSELALRLLDPASSREQTITDLRIAGFTDGERAADALDLARARLPPEWLEEAIASPDPDRALASFRDLSLKGSLGLFALLKQEPHLRRMLASLFGTSERLSRHLLSHPAMWVPLVDGLGAPSPEPGFWMNALTARLRDLDYEEALRELRRFQAEEILRIGLHDVAGNLAPDEVSRQLTHLAQGCLAHAVDLVAAQLVPRYGRPQTGLTVLALGSFGAVETRYGSDLDLVFLYGREGATDRDVAHQEWFGRLAQRLIGALGALLEEGRLYEVDARLRPSGAQGLLVTTYAAFDRYHQEEAAPWERVALLRARPVAGWPWAGEAPPDLDEVAYRPVDEAALRTELLRMRARIESERAHGLHLRFSPGGLTDLEFIAAWGQLRQGVHTTNPLTAISRLEPGLVDDYRFLQRASLRLRLLRDRPDDLLAPGDRPALARSLGLPETDLVEELRGRMARVRAAFKRTLG